MYVVVDTKESSMEAFLKLLNNKLPPIKFVVRVENNDQVPFLDTLIISNAYNRLEVDVFSKED